MIFLLSLKKQKTKRRENKNNKKNLC